MPGDADCRTPFASGTARDSVVGATLSPSRVPTCAPRSNQSALAAPTCMSITPCSRPIRSTPCLRNQRVGLTTTLITKLLANPLAQSRSTEDAGDQLPGSGQVHHTGRLSMAWKRSGVRTAVAHVEGLGDGVVVPSGGHLLG